MTDEEAPANDDEDSVSPLERVSWIALIGNSLVGISITVATILISAPPLLLFGAIAVLALLISLLLVGVMAR